MKDHILEIIRSTLQLRADQVSIDSPIEAVVKDSMDVVELMAVLGQEYHVAFQTADFNNIKTVGDVVQYIETHQNTADPNPQLKTF